MLKPFATEEEILKYNYDNKRKILIEKFEDDVTKRHYLLRLALVIDQFFNVLFWNGSQDETVSSHIGRKIQAGKANKFELLLCKALRKIESKHCIKSLGE